MQSVLAGQAPISCIIPPPFNTHGIIVRLFLDETHARGAQIRYVTRTYVWLFGEESACTTSRWAFGCSDTVMVNIWRIAYRGSAHILLGCWIDANDHIYMYIENLAVDLWSSALLFSSFFVVPSSFMVHKANPQQQLVWIFWSTGDTQPCDGPPSKLYYF